MRSDSLVRTSNITLAVCGVLVGLSVLWLLRMPVALCFLSLGLAAALDPLLDWFNARRLPNWLSLRAVRSSRNSLSMLTLKYSLMRTSRSNEGSALPFS